MEIKTCSFCGNVINKNSAFVQGATAIICRDCVNACNELISEDFNINTVGEEAIKPHLIKKELDKYVIGQEEAKKILSVAVYNHYKRINVKSKVEIQKTNILLQGPTGSGKTYLMENLAKILNIPLVIVDANTFTEAGYVGEDVENILNRLLKKANGNIKKAEKGMVYIDEIDKLAKKNFDLDKKDVGGEGVQQALLKMLEGADVYVEQSDGFMNQKTPINTSNILFVLGGAFVGIDEIIKKRDPSLKKSIGFNSINNKEKEKPINLELTHDDLIEFGFIPEFVGRIPVIVTLSHLKEDELKKILTKPKNAILKQYKALFKADGINLKFNDSAIDYIVSEAMKKNIGARGLRSVIEKQMYEIMFDAPQKEIKNLTVTKEMLNIKKKKAKM